MLRDVAIAATAAVIAATLVLLVWRRRRLQEACATARRNSRFCIIHDEAEAAMSIAAVVSERLSACSHVCDQRLPMADFNPAEHLPGASETVWIMIVDVDREGESAAARRLTKAVRSLKGETPLAGVRVGVLTLAHSVCAFSAASGGAEKFSAGAKLQAALAAAGSNILVPQGCAEVEVQEVEETVEPWVDAVDRAVTGA